MNMLMEGPTLSWKEAQWAAAQGRVTDDCDAPSQWYTRGEQEMDMDIHVHLVPSNVPCKSVGGIDCPGRCESCLYLHHTGR